MTVHLKPRSCHLVSGVPRCWGSEVQLLGATAVSIHELRKRREVVAGIAARFQLDPAEEELALAQQINGHMERAQVYAAAAALHGGMGRNELTHTDVRAIYNAQAML